MLNYSVPVIYCLYYVTHRCRGITMYNIVAQLEGIRERDAYVMEYVKQFFEM